MPFTLSHVVVVLPFRKRITNRFYLTAFILGSMMPDFVYFIPFRISRIVSHTVPSGFLYHLPVGVFFFFLFYLVLRDPLLELLPEHLRRRIRKVTLSGFRFKNLFFVSLFILTGILIHLLWDSFTHRTGYFVRSFSVFRSVFFKKTAHPMAVYTLLQHGSSLLGLCVLLCHFYFWFKRSESIPYENHFTGRLANVMSIFIPSVSLVSAVIFSLHTVEYYSILGYIRAFLASSIRAGGMVFIILCFLWSLYWQISLLRKGLLLKTYKGF